MSVSYNPEFDPTGIEGGIDTNTMPWIELQALNASNHFVLAGSPDGSP